MAQDSRAENRPFHAFVSYHGPDQHEVVWICEQLAPRGVRLWVDYEHNMVGKMLAEMLGEAIKASQTGVVIFGTQGVGKWQAEELNMLVHLRTQGKITRLIPVLLPGVEHVPEQLGILSLMPIKFAEGFGEPHALDTLEEAITGIHVTTKGDVCEILREVPSLGTGCFVATPLEENDARYKLIVGAVKSAGMELLQFRRSDQREFYTDVEKGILAARVVVVDAALDPSACSDSQSPAPEVLYEWGIADALGKPIIVLDNGRSEFPVVATARRRLEYDDAELDQDGVFEKRLADEIRRVTGSLQYPFLTETGLDDIYSHHVRFVSLRPAIWARLCRIIHFGIQVHDQVREVAKHAHKLKQDAQRVFEDLEDIGQGQNSELRRRNWEVFNKSFSGDYLRTHESFDELFLGSKEEEQKGMEDAFRFLTDQLPDALVALAESSFGHYQWALNRAMDYFANHEDLLNQMAKSEEDCPGSMGHVKNLCAGLSEHVNEMDCHLSRMITTLLEVIAREQKPIGGKSDVSRASP